MPKYQIVEFYYDRYGDDIFKSKEKLKQTILSDDSKGTARLWIDHPTDWFTQDYKGTVLKDKVDDINEGYIQEIRDDIERANTEGELGKITIDTDYEPDTQNILERQIAEKLEDLLDYGKQADSIINLVDRADTIDQIDAIDIDIPDSSDRTRAIQAWNDKRFEIQERIEKETGVFPGGQ